MDHVRLPDPGDEVTATPAPADAVAAAPRAEAAPAPGASQWRSAAPAVVAPPRRAWPMPHWSFLAFVLLPGVLAALYFLVIAADQYESESVFVVRGIEAPRGQSSLTELLGAGLASGGGGAESRSVGEYLLSHDAVRALAADGIDLVAIFRRPEADAISRLWFERPRAETLLRHYRGKVALAYDPDDGMTRLTVRAYRPADALAVSRALLKLGEARVNSFNDRALRTVTAASGRDVAAAEAELADIQRRLTRFREVRRDIDPRRNAAGTQELVGDLEGQLAAARAQAAAMRRVLTPGSPQLVAIEARIAGLQGQVGAQSARLTGRGATLAPRLADFEELVLRQGFAAKRYEAARTAQEAARLQAIRQQLFVVPVVEPNLAEKSLYPRRWTSLGAILAGLLVAWGIGWLLVAGFREHAD